MALFTEPLTWLSAFQVAASREMDSVSEVRHWSVNRMQKLTKPAGTAAAAPPEGMKRAWAAVLRLAGITPSKPLAAELKVPTANSAKATLGKVCIICPQLESNFGRGSLSLA